MYEASSSYILINPPAPPTAEEIARDPALGQINSDNPYTRFSDQSVIVEVLASSHDQRVGACGRCGSGRGPAVHRGARLGFGYSEPDHEITAQARPRRWPSERPSSSARGHPRAQRMQQAEGVDRVPDQDAAGRRPRQRAVAGLRPAPVAGRRAGLGAVLLFVVVSVGDGVTTIRVERMGTPRASRSTGEGVGRSGGRAGVLPALRPREGLVRVRRGSPTRNGSAHQRVPALSRRNRQGTMTSPGPIVGCRAGRRGSRPSYRRCVVGCAKHPKPLRFARCCR